MSGQPGHSSPVLLQIHVAHSPRGPYPARYQRVGGPPGAARVFLSDSTARPEILRRYLAPLESDEMFLTLCLAVHVSDLTGSVPRFTGSEGRLTGNDRVSLEVSTVLLEV